MYVCADYFERMLSSNRLNHISRKSISSTSQHHSNVQEVTQTDADDDDFRGSSTLSVSGEKKEINEELGTLSCTSSSCDEEEKANGGTDDSTSEEMAAVEKSASHTQDVQALSSDNNQQVSSDHPTNQEAQTTPKSTNVDLSIPGAFAQHSHCSNKRCNDTECSNYRDIGESTYSCIFVA